MLAAHFAAREAADLFSRDPRARSHGLLRVAPSSRFLPDRIEIPIISLGRYSFFLTTWVYPVVVHWVWSSAGWLSALNPEPLLGTGLIDFAGSGVVHLTGAWSALIGAHVCGQRIGRYNAMGELVDMPGHSAALQVLGTLILWVGWYGFNPGSTLAITGGLGEVAAKAAVNTTLSAAAGAVGSVIIWRMATGRFDLGQTLNGLLTGLVSITAGCAVVEPWAAVIIGSIASIIYALLSEFVKRKLKVRARGRCGACVRMRRQCARSSRCSAARFLIRALAPLPTSPTHQSHPARPPTTSPLDRPSASVRAQIDDVVDAFAVHGGGGCWGLIAASLFCRQANYVKAYGASLDQPYGAFYAPRGKGHQMFVCALVGISVITLWVVGLMYPFFKVLSFMDWLRVPAEEEEVGMDVSKHGGSAYGARRTPCARAAAPSARALLASA